MLSALACVASGVALATVSGCLTRTARAERDHAFAGALCAAGYVVTLIGVFAGLWALR